MSRNWTSLVHYFKMKAKEKIIYLLHEYVWHQGKQSNKYVYYFNFSIIVFRFTQEECDEMFAGAPVDDKGMFNYIEFTRIIKHGSKEE